MRSVALGLILVLGSTLALAVAADAQPAGKMSRRAGPSPFDKAFRQGLRELGYVEGTNIAVEYRWAGGLEA